MTTDNEDEVETGESNIERLAKPAPRFTVGRGICLVVGILWILLVSDGMEITDPPRGGWIEFLVDTELLSITLAMFAPGVLLVLGSLFGLARAFISYFAASIICVVISISWIQWERVKEERAFIEAVIMDASNSVQTFECKHGATVLTAIVAKSGRGVITDGTDQISPKMTYKEAQRVGWCYRLSYQSELCDAEPKQKVNRAFGGFGEADTEFTPNPECRNGMKHVWTSRNPDRSPQYGVFGNRTFRIFSNGRGEYVESFRIKGASSKPWNPVTGPLPGLWSKYIGNKKTTEPVHYVCRLAS